jgi:hypothetical protein
MRADDGECRFGCCPVVPASRMESIAHVVGPGDVDRSSMRVTVASRAASGPGYALVASAVVEACP